MPACIKSTRQHGSVQGPSNFTSDRKKIIEFARSNLPKAQQRQAKYYNQGRREVVFQVSDLFYVDAKVLSSELGKPDYDPTRDPTRNKLLPK